MPSWPKGFQCFWHSWWSTDNWSIGNLGLSLSLNDLLTVAFWFSNKTNSAVRSKDWRWHEAELQLATMSCRVLAVRVWIEQGSLGLPDIPRWMISNIASLCPRIATQWWIQFLISMSAVPRLAGLLAHGECCWFFVVPASGGCWFATQISWFPCFHSQIVIRKGGLGVCQHLGSLGSRTTGRAPAKPSMMWF